MENNEVKNENATEEKKTESDKAEKKFNGAKWRCITIALTAILIFAAMLFFVVTYFQDDSGRSLIEYIEQGLVVVAALISGCVSIISMINGKENGIEQQAHEKKLIEQQQEFEKKWNQKKIDADLKARARIEWIQRVREATAEFVTAGYDWFKGIRLIENSSIIVQKGELLKLYFGKDVDDEEKSNKGELCSGNDKKDEKNSDFLMDKKSNKGKNDAIVEKIQGMIDFFTINKNYQKNNQDDREKYDECVKNLIRFICDHNENYDSINDVYERLEYDSVQLSDEVLASEEYKDYQKISAKIQERENGFNMGKLDEFVDIIRLYLKIEWDRAKNNEDDD